jgi:beta-1,4-mannooligosaccharide/beta-1,4-mannosyl-N-acetylglucosamine phosphorylase
MEIAKSSTKQTALIGDPLPNIPWEPKPDNFKGIVWRHSTNPIVDVNPFPKARGVYNSSVIPWEGKFIGIFRADWHCMTAYLHFGTSDDAINWKFEEDPISFISLDPPLGNMTFAYDPRVSKIDDVYYITWCYNYHGPTIGQAWTKDFKTFHQLENAFLPYNRNGVLFPKKIGGKYAMLSRPMGLGMAVNYGDIFYSESPDLTYWGKHRNVFTRGPKKWERVKIGPGPIPIETTEGWLLLYHGVADTCSGFIYSMGAALLDLEEPSKVIYRCKFPIMTPEATYETSGSVGNVIFPTSVLTDGATGRMAIYYGASDTYTAIAYANIDEILEYIKINNDSTIE